jgi:catechol 2,3-dioxygenase-like lactoylglutathione lyase family enzyme
MIGYVCLGTNDLEAAKPFYDRLLAPLGAKRIWDMDRFVGWGTAEDKPLVILITPYDGKPATVGNGTMVALAAPSREVVDQVHAAALSLGCQDEGAVGLRGDNFYAGYFRVPEGHKLAVFHAS